MHDRIIDRVCTTWSLATPPREAYNNIISAFYCLYGDSGAILLSGTYCALESRCRIDVTAGDCESKRLSLDTDFGGPNVRRSDQDVP